MTSGGPTTISIRPFIYWCLKLPWGTYSLPGTGWVLGTQQSTGQIKTLAFSEFTFFISYGESPMTSPQFLFPDGLGDEAMWTEQKGK